MTDLSSAILAIVAQATAQAPIAHPDIVKAVLRARPETTPDEPHDALEAMTRQRLLATCRITRGGVTQDVYWPTGLKTPAISGNIKEPLAVPHTPSESLSSRLIKAIVAHGPLLADELSEKSGVGKNNIGGNLQHAVKTGAITTRKAYVPERGREMTHYMTATQAQEWDARGEQIEVGPVEEPGASPHGGHVMSHPDAVEAAASVGSDIVDTTLARLADLEHQTEADRQTIHGLRNDVAARDLILHALADKLQVDQIEAIPAALDDLTHALSTRAMIGAAPAGRMALLLIDSAEITDLEELDKHDAPNAQDLAMRSIEQGHAARALVVRIVGEATRRVEWKEAA